uniref:F-box protein 47 n=1 Tax=Seriola lalandi dorsalis TaxID=1841481 RepID=A0A3B4YRI5_SERLL
MVRKVHRNVRRHPLTHKSQYCTLVGSLRNMQYYELKFLCLSVLEISVFSMVSKEITRHVVDYISTLAWKNKMIVQSFHHSTFPEQSSTIEHYRNLGLLLKRCTLLLPTKERLKFIFTNVMLVSLQTLIAGWDELECHRVFNFLCDVTNLLQKIEAVITAKPGVWYQELQLRLFCRQVLLDPWSNQPECQFWLIQLLKPWPMVSQAHLLFILFGPLFSLQAGTLGWQDLVDRGQPHSALWDLARAILLLFGKLTVKGWTTDSMLAILEELIVIPQPWHVENVARLLVLCGSSLCYTVLVSKALKGRLLEISRLIVYIILVCEKDGYHMKWAVKLVQQICKVYSTAPERFCFIREVENMFSEITRDETFQTLCILLDSSARFHTKFLHMFLK